MLSLRVVYYWVLNVWIDGIGEVNLDGFKYYNIFIDMFLVKGIKFYVILYYWDFL